MIVIKVSQLLKYTEFYFLNILIAILLKMLPTKYRKVPVMSTCPHAIPYWNTQNMFCILRLSHRYVPKPYLTVTIL